MVDSEDRSVKLTAGIDRFVWTWQWVRWSQKEPMNDHQQNVPGRRTRREFDETFKRNAVELTMKGDRSIRQVADQLDIGDTLLRTWRKKYGPVPTSVSGVKGAMSSEEKDAEIAALRAEVIRMREREIVLKKSLGILSETPESGMPRSRR